MPRSTARRWPGCPPGAAMSASSATRSSISPATSTTQPTASAGSIGCSFSAAAQAVCTSSLATSLAVDDGVQAGQRGGDPHRHRSRRRTETEQRDGLRPVGPQPTDQPGISATQLDRRRSERRADNPCPPGGIHPTQRRGRIGRRTGCAGGDGGAGFDPDDGGQSDRRYAGTSPTGSPACIAASRPADWVWPPVGSRASASSNANTSTRTSSTAGPAEVRWPAPVRPARRRCRWRRTPDRCRSAAGRRC